jgi:hypothetical protein
MFVGIDVAKAVLVVSLLASAERITVNNEERGIPHARRPPPERRADADRGGSDGWV